MAISTSATTTKAVFQTSTEFWISKSTFLRQVGASEPLRTKVSLKLHYFLVLVVNFVEIVNFTISGWVKRL